MSQLLLMCDLSQLIAVARKITERKAWNRAVTFRVMVSRVIAVCFAGEVNSVVVLSSRRRLLIGLLGLRFLIFAPLIRQSAEEAVGDLVSEPLSVAGENK
jgi:hypothetical protein